MPRLTAQEAGHVRFGSKADMALRNRHVRFTPKSGHSLALAAYPLSAKSGHRITSFYRNPGLILNFTKCGQQSDNRNEHRCKT